MPNLTRHLYETDEVVAALMWCVVTGRVMESAFWCQELLESDAASLVRNTLFNVWLWHFGCKALGIGQQILTTQDKFLEIAVTLSRSAYKWRDGSTFALLVHGYKVNTEFDRVAEWGEGSTPAERAFRQSLKQHKTLLAWTIARSRWPHAWDWFEAPTWLLEAESRDSWAVRAVAVAATVLTDKERQESEATSWRLPPSEIEDALLVWEESSGRRKRRLYTIPVDALFWLTARGNTSYKESTAGAIQDALDDSLRSSEFWTTFLPSDFEERDQSYSDFYETWFPDDIPDEWSRADREKSHGPGVLQPTETPRFEKYARKWWGRCERSVLWDGVQSAIRVLSEMPADTDLSRLYDEKQGEWVQEDAKWALTPVKKSIVIAT